MSQSLTHGATSANAAGAQSVGRTATFAPGVTGYLVTPVLVALAAVLAFVVENLISAPNLTLIFVVPVVVAATAFGWGPALLAAATGVLSFDFFFTEPRYSFRIASPSDIWAAALLLAIAAIVSTVATESRRRAVESRRAAERAEALQALAHAVIEARPEAEILQTAATTLGRIFKAPAVVFLDDKGAFHPAARTADAALGPDTAEAARAALSAHTPTRGESYPYDRSAFDFWPVGAGQGCRFVLGVDFTHSSEERPEAPQGFVDLVGGYLATALARR